jgi:hypothetical protein
VACAGKRLLLCLHSSRCSRRRAVAALGSSAARAVSDRALQQRPNMPQLPPAGKPAIGPRVVRVGPNDQDLSSSAKRPRFVSWMGRCRRRSDRARRRGRDRSLRDSFPVRADIFPFPSIWNSLILTSDSLFLRCAARVRGRRRRLGCSRAPAPARHRLGRVEVRAGFDPQGQGSGSGARGSLERSRPRARRRRPDAPFTITMRTRTKHVHLREAELFSALCGKLPDARRAQAAQS